MPSTPTKYSMPNDGIHGVALDELKVGRRGIEPRPQQQREREHHERHGERDAVNQRLALAVRSSR